MANTILTSEQTESQILGKDWYGKYQIACMVYTDHLVKLQFRNPDHPTRGETWITARHNDTEIIFKAAGDVFDFEFVRDFDYQFTTDTKGAEIDLGKHDPHG